MARFDDDPHLLGSVLWRELVDAGFERAYTTMIGELRRLQLRPVCRVCEHRGGRAVTTEIAHPAGEEIQWDWLELPETPWGQKAFVLVGALARSGRFRAVFCEQMTFGHLAAAAHRVLVATHLSFREVGERLYVSRHTVKSHALAVYRKLNVTSRNGAVERARGLGLL